MINRRKLLSLAWRTRKSENVTKQVLAVSGIHESDTAGYLFNLAASG